MVQASCSRPAAVAALRSNTGGIFDALCATEALLINIHLCARAWSGTLGLAPTSSWPVASSMRCMIPFTVAARPAWKTCKLSTFEAQRGRRIQMGRTPRSQSGRARLRRGRHPIRLPDHRLMGGTRAVSTSGVAVGLEAASTPRGPTATRTHDAPTQSEVAKGPAGQLFKPRRPTLRASTPGSLSGGALQRRVERSRTGLFEAGVAPSSPRAPSRAAKRV
jgi:hypothetical protein